MKRKDLIKLFVVLTGMMLMLTACGKKEIAELKTENEELIQTEEALKESEETLIDEPVDENVTKDSEESEISDKSEPESTLADESFKDNEYGEIIQLYSDYFTDWQNWDIMDDRISIGVTEVVRYVENPYNYIGYVLEDISGDGNPEMIIVAPGEYGVNASMVLAVYAMTEDGPVRVFQGASRSLYYLLDDNTFYNEGSNGADDSSWALYRLSENGTEKVEIKGGVDYSKRDGYTSRARTLEMLSFKDGMRI